MKKTTGLVKNSRTGHRDVCEKILISDTHSSYTCICAQKKEWGEGGGRTSCIMHHNHTQRFANQAGRSTKSRGYAKRHLYQKKVHGAKGHLSQKKIQCAHIRPAKATWSLSARAQNCYCEHGLIQCTLQPQISKPFLTTEKSVPKYL